MAPGDPVDRFVSLNTHDETFPTNEHQIDSTRAAWRHLLGLDLPIFYVSIQSMEDSKHEDSNSTVYYWIPTIQVHSDNQFHRWLFGDGQFTEGIVHGDFGKSYNTRQPVAKLLTGRMIWSVGLTLVAMALAFMISIPIALRAAQLRDKTFDRIIQSISLTLLSLPSFWIAILLLTLFANPNVLDWLPASGIGPLVPRPNRNFIQQFSDSLPYLILPTICYTLGTTAFLLRSIRDAASQELMSDYARTASAKGHDKRTILNRHVLRNLLPSLLTIAAFAFPAAISGAVLLEYIFGIPGMGSLLQEAVVGQDYPVLSAVFLISSFITLSGFAVCDLLIARLDPRIVKGGSL